MQHAIFANENFIRACRDYFYLIDRKYPEKGSLKLTGDRYRLSGDERTVLYRGISSAERSGKRNGLLVDKINNQPLWVDGYNVAFTLLNYRLGRTMFVSTDNILRDAGAFHGRIKDETLFIECVELMTGFMPQLMPSSVQVYLDSPVSHSEKHADVIRSMLKVHEVPGECHVIKSADWALKQYREGVISTSDTVIIEKTGLPVLDLPRAILQERFGATFLCLGDVIGMTP